MPKTLNQLDLIDESTKWRLYSSRRKIKVSKIWIYKLQINNCFSKGFFFLQDAPKHTKGSIHLPQINNCFSKGCFFLQDAPKHTKGSIHSKKGVGFLGNCFGTKVVDVRRGLEVIGCLNMVRTLKFRIYPSHEYVLRTLCIPNVPVGKPCVQVSTRYAMCTLITPSIILTNAK